MLTGWKQMKDAAKEKRIKERLRDNRFDETKEHKRSWRECSWARDEL